MPIEELKIKLPDITSRGYSINIGSGVWDQLPEFLAGYQDMVARFVIITNDKLEELFGEKLAHILQKKELAVDTISFPAGEQYKTQEIKTKLDNRMLELGCGRDTMILAFGGGVVGDVAGYVAATYMRGIPYIQLPTSLLAMIDSSVGGKTGIDTAYGKNLIGAFHQPEAVFADVNVLASLPESEVINGMWEAIKIFLTYNAEMFDYVMNNWSQVLAKDEEVITRIVSQAVELKIGVVTRDEKECGERKVVNFGHTVGHALELLSNYKLMHGEAVALGVLVESKISELMGILSTKAFARVEAAVEKTGVDRGVLKKYKAEEIIAKMKLDKKCKAGVPQIVLLEDIGKVHVGGGEFASEVEESKIIEALSQ